MAEKKKKKKRSTAQMHRQIQDNVEQLPYAVTMMQQQGKPFRAFILKYISGPILRLIKRVLDRQRYHGPEGAKLKQSERMKRHLEQRTKAMEYMQGELRKAQQKQQKRKGPR
ncbi:MAG TPA: hypothetical protein VEW03_16030 [Longimicrobiaceae bacterium]|nr:hypothetical protein [Longimicrobiaceae bacterium]